MSSTTVIRLICATVGVPAFALSVAVQHNDPDPLPWMAIYGAACALCGLRAAGRRAANVAAVVAVVAVLWAATLVPGAIVWLQSDHEALGPTMKTGDEGEEVTREMGGLLLVAVACGLLGLEGRRRRNRAG